MAAFLMGRSPWATGCSSLIPAAAGGQWILTTR
jgi:hypothetical protein